MLRAAIQTLSPDEQEIQNALFRSQDEPTAAPIRQLVFRLMLTVVVLVLMILVLDLLFS